MSATVGMVDPWGQVVRECEAGSLPEPSIALTYAFGLRQTPHERVFGFGDPEITAANVALERRFGADGRERVKGLAWKILRGEVAP